MSEDPKDRRKQLGRLLRRAREAVVPKLTQAAVAEHLGCQQAKVNKIEMTLVAIGPRELEKLIELYDVPADLAEEMRTLAEHDQRNGPARTKFSTRLAAYDELSELETEASEIRCWHSERLPVPLQSELYRLKQHESLMEKGAVDATRVLRERAARIRVFTVAGRPRFRVILSESSLHRMPGGRTTQLVVDQSEYLLKLMDEHEQLELRILPFTADIPYVDSDFQHLMFAGSASREFVYIEFPGGTRRSKNAHERAECRAHWDALSAAALDVDGTRDFLKGLIRKAGSSTF